MFLFYFEIEFFKKKNMELSFTIYLKLTNKCNLNCKFCYVEKKNQSLEELDQKKLAYLVYDKLIKELEKKYWIHLVFHGGEFSLYPFEKLKTLIFELRKKSKKLYQLSAMSNLTTKELSKNIENYLNLGIGLSGSYNKYVKSKLWLRNAKKIYSIQKSLHLNQVFDKYVLNKENYISTLRKLKDLIGPNIVFKYERFVCPNFLNYTRSESEYYDSSKLMIDIFENILNNNINHNNVYTMTFPFLLLAYSYENKKKFSLKGFFCSSHCVQYMIVIDSNLELSLCTKKYKKTKIGSIFDQNILDKFKEKSNELINKIDPKCIDCKYFSYCLGTCPFVEPFDQKNECANSRSVIDYLLNLKEKYRHKLYLSNEFMKNYLSS